MLFNSISFVCFFLVVRVLYGFAPFRLQNFILLIASYSFYGAWDVRFLGLLFLSTLVDYGCALGMHRFASRRRLLLGASLVVNLGVLGTFKYFDFFASELSGMLRALGYEMSPVSMQFVLPVGISFYTFQTLSYTIDVYRGRLQPTKNFLDFALYVSFFPQLVAGPIERARRLLPQIAKKRIVTEKHLQRSLWLLLLGYFQKIVVADNLAPYVERLVSDPFGQSGGDLAVGFYMMIFFLYADFSGYSNIARGLANALGFDLMQNFRMPLFARNPISFWQRWHISLSAWFRDYVYLPLVRLGGASRSPWVIAAATLVTLAIVGLWHGAAWHFVLFGLYHGCLLVGYGALRRWRGRGVPLIMSRVWQHIAAFHVIGAGTLFFFLKSPADVMAYVTGIVFGPWVSPDLTMLTTLLVFCLPMMMIDAFQERKDDIFAVMSMPWLYRWIIYSALWMMICLCGASQSREFVYFQF